MSTTSGNPSYVVNGVKCVDMWQLIDASRGAWEALYPAERVVRNVVPASFGDTINRLVDWDASETNVVHAVTDVFPVIVIPGLPAARYPEYMSFLYRATVAALAVESPAIASSLDKSGSMSLVAAAVAVRAGTWAAMGVLPAGSKLSMALKYDPKRAAVWVRGATMDVRTSAWRTHLATVGDLSSNGLELMLHLCVVAPTMMCSAASATYSSGGMFGMEYVEDSVSRCLKARMTAAAYKVSGLSRAVMWDVMRNSSISGLPEAAVRAWGADPAVAVCASRRALTETHLIEWSRKREAKLRSVVSPSPITVLGCLAKSDDIWADVRASMGRGVTKLPDDDTVSMFTTSDTSPTPRPASPVRTAAVTRAPSPVREPSAEERQTFRDILAGAHSNDILADDALMGMNADMPVLM